MDASFGKMLAGIHQIGALGPAIAWQAICKANLPRAGADLIGHAVPCLCGMDAVRLFESLTDRGGHNRVLALRDVCQCVTHPGNAATLPGRLKAPGDGGLEASVGIADHQLHPIQTTGLQ